MNSDLIFKIITFVSLIVPILLALFVSESKFYKQLGNPLMARIIISGLAACFGLVMLLGLSGIFLDWPF